MKSVSRTIVLLAVLGIVFSLFRNDLSKIWSSLQNKYLPCSKAITYSIGSFDERFGISEKEFLKVAEIAEATWEKSINRELFNYNPDENSILKINLIYDIRQESSEQLKNIGTKVDSAQDSYNSLKSEYAVLKAEYLEFQSSLSEKTVAFQARQDIYERDVNRFNTAEKQSEKEYNRLDKEKEYLEAEFTEISRRENELSAKAQAVNSLVTRLNSLARTLNIRVEKFNTIGGKLGEEFEEGVYKEDSYRREIDIYQFDNKDKLKRVLAHEFGHALGLPHLEDPNAVMYRLNNGKNEKLTAEDVKALETHCGI